MKNIGLVCLLLVSICCGLQAKKIVKVPYFMACNTRSIEVEQVTLGKDRYGTQGTADDWQVSLLRSRINTTHFFYAFIKL